MKQEKIGIAITTRNRPDVLSICLKHFNVFTPRLDNIEFFILDDNSDFEEAALNVEACESNGFTANYLYSHERLGIAKAKNQCLHHLSNCDFWFLFDDDCFPKKSNWYQLYLDCYRNSGCHHLLYNAHIGPYAPVGHAFGVEEYNAELGVLMFMTRHCIDVIGGFDERYGIYGYEHMEYARRAQEALLTNKLGRACVPVGASEYIYTFDLDWQMGKIPPPLQSLQMEFHSSLSEEPLEAYRIHARKINGIINEEISRCERVTHVPISGQNSLDFI